MPSGIRWKFTLALAITGAFAAGGIPATAQAADPFYKGKTITLITSTGEGGSYDLGARIIATHMPAHLAGSPSIIVKNMPGGGHTRATNFLFGQAPKDGTTIATVSNTIPMHQILNGKGVRYDASKFNWIGSTGISNLTIAAWHTAGVTSIEDLKTKEVPAGATGAGSGTFIYLNVLNNLIGTKVKIVAGYRSSAEIDLAMERGEVGIRGGGSYLGFTQDRMEWIKSGKIRFIAQVGPRRHPALKDVPLFHELGTSDEQRQILKLISSPVLIGRPYVAPPDIPAERVAELRAAFTATMNDKSFITEAEKRGLDVDPSTGDEIQRIAMETIATPADLVAKAKAVMEPPTEMSKPPADTAKN